VSACRAYRPGFPQHGTTAVARRWRRRR